GRPTATICSPLIPTSQRPAPWGVTTVPLAITVSSMGRSLADGTGAVNECRASLSALETAARPAEATMNSAESPRAGSRRQFIGTAAAAAGMGLVPLTAGAQAGPWAQRPPGAPGSVTFVVWQYGKIYEQIAKQFEDDWSVKVSQIIEPNVEPQVAKLTTMFAAGDAVDVSQSPMQYLANYIDQGIAQPIDGLPGGDQYIRDFTPFTRAVAQRDGKTWGLPYFSTVWTFMYNDELLGKAGFKDKPFRGYPELVEQARKAKKDGVAKYPILWIGGQGFEQLP